MNNPFLESFLKMRKTLNVSALQEKPRGVAHMPEPEETITLAHIITKKPPNKDVIQYFRERVKQLERENS